MLPMHGQWPDRVGLVGPEPCVSETTGPPAGGTSGRSDLNLRHCRRLSDICVHGPTERGSLTDGSGFMGEYGAECWCCC